MKITRIALTHKKSGNEGSVSPSTVYGDPSAVQNAKDKYGNYIVPSRLRSKKPKR